MSEELQDLIEQYPYVNNYIDNGVIQWDKLNIDIEAERKEDSYTTDENLLIDLVLVGYGIE
jgi:hypothetical protein